MEAHYGLYMAYIENASASHRPPPLTPIAWGLGSLPSAAVCSRALGRSRPWRRFGAVRGAFWGILGPIPVHFGALGSILGHFGARLGSILVHFGA